MSDSEETIKSELIQKYRSRTEEERKADQQQYVSDLKFNATNPALKPDERQEYAEIFQRALEDIQVQNLYDAAKQSPFSEVRAGADPLIKTFMNDHAEMLHNAKRPHAIGQPADFSKWLLKKPFSNS